MMRSTANLILAIVMLPSALSFAMTRSGGPSLRVSKLEVLRAPLRNPEAATAPPDATNRFRLDQPVYVPSRSRLINLDSITRNVVVVSAVSGAAVGSLIAGRGLMKSIQKITVPRASYARDPFREGLDRFIPYSLRVTNAKLGHTLSAIRSRLASAVTGGGQPVDINKWNTASLASVSPLPGGYVKYRFRLDTSSTYLPLDVGQEVVISLMDDKDRVIKDSYFPSSPLGVKGYFDIVATVDENTATTSALTAEEKFARAMLELRIGDDIAFRGGRHRLSGSSPWLGGRMTGSRKQKEIGDPITRVSLVAAGAGITPTAQLLRYVYDGVTGKGRDVYEPPLGKPLANNKSLQGELLWLNEREEDFIGAIDIKRLGYRYGKKLKTKKVLESDLYSPDLVRNGKFIDSLSPYTPGSVAIICAPEHLVEQFRFLYRELGYPVDSILSVMSNS